MCCPAELTRYRRFLNEFSRTDDNWNIKFGSYMIEEVEIPAESINWVLQYLIEGRCPSSLIIPLIKRVTEEIHNESKSRWSRINEYSSRNKYKASEFKRMVFQTLKDYCSMLSDNVELTRVVIDDGNNLSLPSSTYSVASVKNTRRTMEDRYICIDDFNGVYNIQNNHNSRRKLVYFYGVFDGHDGYNAACYTSSHLPYNIAKDLAYPSNVTEALQRAFTVTDNNFIRKNTKSGTTALCALHYPDESKLYVAWVGDSKALLVKKENILQLVIPHKPCVRSEATRVENQGGSIMLWQGALRVNGLLNLTRAIGDISCKPYVISDPDIKCVELDGEEDFLILASDGLWDHVSETDSARAVYKHIQSHKEINSVASNLVELAKKRGSSDNITVIVVFLKKPSLINEELLNNKIESTRTTKSKKPSKMDTFDNRFSGNLNLDNTTQSLVPNANTELDLKSKDVGKDVFQKDTLINDGLNNLLDPLPPQSTTNDTNNPFTTTMANINTNFNTNDIILDDKSNIDLLSPSFDDNHGEFNENHHNNHHHNLLQQQHNNHHDDGDSNDNELQKMSNDDKLSEMDMGPETSVDTTDDVMMMVTENSETTDLLEHSPLSHSKETLPSSDNMNPFDVKNSSQDFSGIGTGGVEEEDMETGEMLNQEDESSNRISSPFGDVDHDGNLSPEMPTQGATISSSFNKFSSMKQNEFDNGNENEYDDNEDEKETILEKDENYEKDDEQKFAAGDDFQQFIQNDKIEKFDSEYHNNEMFETHYHHHHHMTIGDNRDNRDTDNDDNKENECNKENEYTVDRTDCDKEFDQIQNMMNTNTTTVFPISDSINSSHGDNFDHHDQQQDDKHLAENTYDISSPMDNTSVHREIPFNSDNENLFTQLKQEEDNIDKNKFKFNNDPNDHDGVRQEQIEHDSVSDNKQQQLILEQHEEHLHFVDEHQIEHQESVLDKENANIITGELKTVPEEEISKELVTIEETEISEIEGIGGVGSGIGITGVDSCDESEDEWKYMKSKEGEGEKNTISNQQEQQNDNNNKENLLSSPSFSTASVTVAPNYFNESLTADALASSAEINTTNYFGDFESEQEKQEEEKRSNKDETTSSSQSVEFKQDIGEIEGEPKGTELIEQIIEEEKQVNELEVGSLSGEQVAAVATTAAETFIVDTISSLNTIEDDHQLESSSKVVEINQQQAVIDKIELLEQIEEIAHNTKEEQNTGEDMSTRLNPDAEEFVPSSAPNKTTANNLSTTMTTTIDGSSGFSLDTSSFDGVDENKSMEINDNKHDENIKSTVDVLSKATTNIDSPVLKKVVNDDDIISQSPRKGAINMEDMNVPDENTFQDEIHRRPGGLSPKSMNNNNENENEDDYGDNDVLNLKEAMHSDEKESEQIYSPLSSDNADMMVMGTNMKEESATNDVVANIVEVKMVEKVHDEIKESMHFDEKDNEQIYSALSSDNADTMTMTTNVEESTADVLTCIETKINEAVKESEQHCVIPNVETKDISVPFTVPLTVEETPAIVAPIQKTLVKDEKHQEKDKLNEKDKKQEKVVDKSKTKRPTVGTAKPKLLATTNKVMKKPLTSDGTTKITTIQDSAGTQRPVTKPVSSKTAITTSSAPKVSSARPKVPTTTAASKTTSTAATTTKRSVQSTKTTKPITDSQPKISSTSIKSVSATITAKTKPLLTTNGKTTMSTTTGKTAPPKITKAKQPPSESTTKVSTSTNQRVPLTVPKSTTLTTKLTSPRDIRKTESTKSPTTIAAAPAVSNKTKGKLTTTTGAIQKSSTANAATTAGIKKTMGTSPSSTAPKTTQIVPRKIKKPTTTLNNTNKMTTTTTKVTKKTTPNKINTSEEITSNNTDDVITIMSPVAIKSSSTLLIPSQLKVNGSPNANTAGANLSTNEGIGVDNDMTVEISNINIY